MKAIAAAFLSAQMEMGNAIKDSKNPFFKSNYADFNSVKDACLPILNRHGIALFQPTVTMDGKNYVKTLLIHVESGETIESFTEILYSKPNDAQAQGSGITYARRYGLQSLVSIGAEDDDGNKASGNKEPMITAWQITKIETLLQTSAIDEEEKGKIERNITKLTEARAYECIVYLESSQVDPIEAGHGYSLTQINKKVKQVLNDERK